MAERARHRCEYCHAPEAVFNFAMEVEHVVPRARGGGDDPSNLALARRACNLFKSDFEAGFDEESQAEAPLFNPRRDVWEQHFRVDAESGSIAGLTPAGRATVVRLRLNRPRHVNARRRWAALEIFP